MGVTKIGKAALTAIAVLVLLAHPSPTAAQEEEDVENDVEIEQQVDTGAYAARKVRFTVSGMSALTALVDARDTWEFSFGGSVGMTKSGPGLGGFLQVGYLSGNHHWSHAIPIDFGGQYRWGTHVKTLFVSGGMSFIALQAEEGIQPEGIFPLGESWEMVPLIYVDLGGRIMLHPAVGLDFKVETRTYWAINIFSLKLSLVF
jgi:hypothetical protein